MAAIAVAAAVVAAIGIGMAINGASQKAKAKRIAASNVRPFYSIQKPEEENQRVVDSLLGKGMQDASKQYYTTSAERGLSSSIDAILKAGGDTSTIGRVYTGYNDAMGRISLADDAARVQNIQLYLEQNRRMSQELDKKWQVNEFAPYADTARRAEKLADTGEKNIWNGIQMVGSAASMYAGGTGQQKSINDVNGKGQGTTSATGDSGGSGGIAGGGIVSGAFSNSNRQYGSGSYGNSNSNNMSYMRQNWENLTPEQREMIMGLSSNKYNY